MKKWLKVTIVTDPVLVDSIGDFLLGVIGAAVESGVDSSPVTLNGFVEKENPDQEEIEAIRVQINDHMESLAKIFQVEPPRLSWTIIADEDWGKSWKKHFVPFAIIPGLVIAPTWEKYQAVADECVIVMDPGMAFGTGHHATTALSLQLINEELRRGEPVKSVVDVGTGTGILGMAAALFGAERVTAIDNDADAVTAAGENIRRNRLDSVMTVSATALSDLQGQHSLVVANIIHDVLVQMAGDLRRLTARGGKLILSGILAGEQVQNIIAVFQEHDFVMETERRLGEWAALRFLRT
jgi:ribosomal protein L11 methyltransferase